jgi:hypothetical protein
MGAWAVIYYLRQESGREQHIARRYVLDVPEDATASDLRFALDAAGMTPAEFGIEWANHSLMPLEEGARLDTRGEPETVTWDQVNRAGNLGRRVTLRLSPGLHRRVTAAAESTGKSINTWCVEVLQRSASDAAVEVDYSRFTERARRVMELTHEEAQRLNHNYIGTEHQLLALLRVEEGVAARVLNHLGVTLERARESVRLIIGRGEGLITRKRELTPRAKQVLALATDEARHLNNRYVGTEHILLGIVREGEGIAAGVLENLGVRLENVRTRVMQIITLTLSAPVAAGDAEPRTCSFCGKDQQEVRRLVAGPGGVYICNECVEMCNRIVADASASDASRDRDESAPNG